MQNYADQINSGSGLSKEDRTILSSYLLIPRFNKRKDTIAMCCTDIFRILTLHGYPMYLLDIFLKTKIFQQENLNYKKKYTLEKGKEKKRIIEMDLHYQRGKTLRFKDHQFIQ